MSLRQTLQKNVGYNLKCGNLQNKNGIFKFILNDNLKDPIDKFIESQIKPSAFIDLEATLLLESERGLGSYVIWSGKLPLSSIHLEQIEYLNERLQKLLNKTIPGSGLDIGYQRRDGKDIVVITW